MIRLLCPLFVALLLTACTGVAPQRTAAVETPPSEWFFEQRAFPHGRVPPGAYRAAVRQALALGRQTAAERSNLVWQQAGPYNVGGRVAALAVHPSQPQTVYVGAASGGIFKTTNGGASWSPVFDAYGPGLSIGALAVAPSDPQTLYAGTGEANAGGGSMTYDGLGIFKTTDGGATWQPAGLEHSGSIGQLAVDPQNADRVFAAAMGDLFGDTPDCGIYRTLDGGATWQHVLAVNDSTGGIDVVLHPTNAQIVYATLWERVRRPHMRRYHGPGSAIYRSTDGGTTWMRLGPDQGLPAAQLGRIGIAVTPAAPDVVYAQIATSANLLQIWKSTDAGEHWTQADAGSALAGAGSSFPWWFGRIVVDPTSADRVYALAVQPHRSTDGGATWASFAGVHADQHALWINPANPAKLVLGNDGGVYWSSDGGTSWTHTENLPITQFYTCEIDENAPERLFGGTQDNGTNGTDGDPTAWQHYYGGDGFVTLVDPVNSQYFYAEFQYGNFARSDDGGLNMEASMNGMTFTGERRNWNTPYVLDPSNPAVLYYGANRVYKSTDHGANWTPISGDLTAAQPGSGGVVYGTLTTLAVSPVNPAVIWTGSDDGRVHRSANGGTTWLDVSAGLPQRWVTRVVAHPTQPATAYVTLSGYRWHEHQPHVLRTTDGGQTWTDLSVGLPEAPVNDLVCDVDLPGTLYVGTDVGVYVSADDGGTWQPLGEGLPLVPVLDLRFHRGARKLAAATYGRSMYTLDLPLLVGTAAPARPGLTVALRPNTLTEVSRVELELTVAGTVAMDIFDSTGKKVTALPAGHLPAGRQTIELPRGLIGERGVYFLRVQQHGVNRVAKFVVL